MIDSGRGPYPHAQKCPRVAPSPGVLGLTPSGTSASPEWSASPEHLRRELTEVEVVPPGGNEPIADLDDTHQRQGSGCSVSSRKVIDALCHDNRIFGHHVDHFDVDLTTYFHELSEGRFDGNAPSDWVLADR
jgi:hypothetical protein